MRDHAGLSGSSPGEDQQGTVDIFNRRALLRVHIF